MEKDVRIVFVFIIIIVLLFFSYSVGQTIGNNIRRNKEEEIKIFYEFEEATSQNKNIRN